MARTNNKPPQLLLVILLPYFRLSLVSQRQPEKRLRSQAKIYAEDNKKDTVKYTEEEE